MSIIKQRLINKIVDAAHYSNVIRIVGENIANDVNPIFTKGLTKIIRIILAKPYTKYGWLLVIYNALGMTRDGNLIVYYNSEEPRWTAAVLIHETVHLALGIKHSSTVDTIVDEALAYTATLKSEQLRTLYVPGIKQAVKLLSRCTNPYGDFELVNIIVPRILAYRLTSYNYQDLVNNLMESPRRIYRLWLETQPPKDELHALATALHLAGVTAFEEIKALENACREVTSKEAGGNTSKYILEGVDKHFIRMLEILRKAATNRHAYREVLKPWWNELKDIESEVVAFIELHSGNTA